MRPNDPAFRRFVLSAVPSLAGWRTYGRTCVNLFAFGFAVLAGTWTVHQLEYSIEYGRHFQAVMATTPHRFYMGQIGLLLAAGILLAGVVALSILVAGHVRLERVRQRLTSRYQRYLTTPLPAVPLRSIGVTAALLFALQTGTYLLQENLETLASLNALPGLAVLLAPQHTTVLPLQVLIAACGSLLLWTVSAWLHRSRQASHLARVLVALFEGPPRRSTRPAAPRSYIPSLRLRTGSHGLRSPPLLACNVIAPLASR
jgi:hypothetical protein